jgi:hypothetical protein
MFTYVPVLKKYNFHTPHVLLNKLLTTKNEIKTSLDSNFLT